MDTQASPQLDENNYIITELDTGTIPHKSNYYSVAYHKKAGGNGVSSKTTNGIKDWNAEFQEIMDDMATSSDPSLFDKLSTLASDFTFVAKTYGKIIILERYLPEPAKTIKPIQIGGLAGGEKYITQGILFKFAMDIHGIYGGDEYSMKAASHDLKGLMGYYKSQIPGLHFPLMTLIDYRGFRLVAMSVLPLSQLLYGSNNGGMTVYNRDSSLNDLMVFAATKLNLKGHYVGSEHVLLHAPADIEGHRGIDGRFYLLDFARTFPPEAPITSPHKSVMYYRLRSEFVKKFGTALSSDAYSAFGKDESEIHDKEVKQATKHLKRSVIPEFSKWLEEQAKERNWLTTRQHISSWMHREGINVRHLGIVRSCYFSAEENDNSSTSICSSSSSTSRSTSSSTSAPLPLPLSSSSTNLLLLTRSSSPSSTIAPSPIPPKSATAPLPRFASRPNLDSTPSNIRSPSHSSRVPPSPTKRPALPSTPQAQEKEAEKGTEKAGEKGGEKGGESGKGSTPGSPHKRNLMNLKNSRIPVLKRVNLGEKFDSLASPSPSPSPSVAIPTPSATVPPSPRSSSPPSSSETNINHEMQPITNTKNTHNNDSANTTNTSLITSGNTTNTNINSAKDVATNSNTNNNTANDTNNNNTTNTNNNTNKNAKFLNTSNPALNTSLSNISLNTSISTSSNLSHSTSMELDSPKGEREIGKEGEELFGKMKRIESVTRGERSHSFSLFEDFMSNSDSMSISSSPRENFDTSPANSRRRAGSVKSSTSSLNVGSKTALSPSFLLLHEMIARVVKTTLREKLRCRMQLVSTPSEKPFKLEILEYFNLVLGRKSESEFYWQNDIKHEILRKFHKSLTQRERETDYPLNRGIDMYYVLQRVMKMTGVRIQPSAMEELRTNPDIFQFVYPDIEKMSATVKDMNIVAHAEGTALYMQSTKQKGHEGDRLFLLAMERYEAALSSTPDNVMMFKNWGDALYQQGLRKAGEDRFKLFLDCAEKFRASKNYESLLTLATNLHKQANREAGRDREQLFSLACENFKATLELYRANKDLQPLIPNLFMLWGDMLWDQAITRVGVDKTEAFIVAGQKYMEACELLHVSQGPKATSLMVKQYPALSAMSPADVACLMRISHSDEALTSVDASLCNKQISDDVINFLATHQPLLHTLKLSGCKSISAAAFQTSFPSLTYLDVRDCQRLAPAEDFATRLAAHIPSLLSLFLGNNPLLSFPPLPPPPSPSSSPSSSPRSPAPPVFAKLHTLDLQQCRSLAPDAVVALCAQCPVLTNLNMAGCIQLLDSDVARILKAAPKIKEINFSRCKITDAALVRAGALTGLRIGYCGSITKSSLGPLITRSPGLSHVKLPGCLVTDSIVVSIAKHCPNLATLDISHCSVTDFSLFEIAERSTNLTYLGLNKCQQITNEAIIRVTQHCTKLEVLKLGGLYKMGPEGLASAAHHCPSLVALDINGCERIESATIVLLAHNCPKLTSINLGDCRLITDMAIVKLSQRCTSLTSVNLFNCRNIHNESLLSLAQNCPKLADLELAFTAITASAVDSLAKLSRSSLRVLGLSQCKIITDMAIISIANHCPMLEDLDLSSCHKISDMAIMNIAKYLGGSLRVLCLGGCYKLTDTSIMRVAQDSPNLQILKVGNCYKLTDASIIKLAHHCPNLATLLVNGCKQLTDASIIALANNTHNLQKISVESCPLISRPALLELRQKCPMLQYRTSTLV